MRQGWGNADACRQVGVNRKTGRRWMSGVTVQRGGRTYSYPPISAGPRPVSARFLSAAERVVIADLLVQGCSLRAIGRRLGRDPSTISREVRRNRQPDNERPDGGRYHPYAAQERAQARRPRPKVSKIAGCPLLRGLVQAMLQCRHSPQQISARLRRDWPERSELHVSHETIYQALYVQGRGLLRRELATALRTGRAARRPRRAAGQRQPRFTHPMVMISDRPAEADDRAVPGHWEGDLIIGKDNGSAIATLVERATRYLLLAHLGAGRDAHSVRDALQAAVTTLPAHLKRSLTWDQGTEMALHHQFSTATGMPVYFCDPHSPWQRGCNENTNGLLRQYFPKSTDLSVHNPDQLAAVAAELNARPRKTLGWDTPAERLATLLTSN